MPSTLKDLAEFCHKHQKRREKSGQLCYRDIRQWGHLIVDAADKNKLYLVETKDSRLIGVAIATQRPATKSLYVHEIVCKSNAFPTFVKTAFGRFPDYIIKGKRNNKILTYNKKNLWVTMHQAA